MLRKHVVLICSALFVLGLSVSVAVHADEWKYLGSSHVNGRVDHDNIQVGKSDGRFRAIQLRVSGGPIEFQRVVVHYGNGSQEEVAVRESIPSGGKTRAIDLPGERRVIESVEIWYAKERMHSSPKVSLYGIR
ncbi:MAG TPA: hypothetical protein VK525_21685 [Candidatus Saccharimonadales bacterium]|nr:hypothetical protein [Candidatus Saccharimonadales bacterium]